jgi:hypothetical protein
VRSCGRVVAALAVGAVLALTGAGCGGSRSAIQLELRVTSYPNGKQTTKRFTLGCRPTSGSLPLAARVCRDIARHPQAMVAPRAPRSTCGGGPLMPTVDVVVVRGAPGGFSGSPGCGWPGGTPSSIYYAASIRDRHTLNLLERRLRCEDDPAFFVRPSPWASILACTHGLWTPAAERAIGVAETSSALQLLRPEKLFPADPGVVRCRIPAGGPVSRSGPRILDGLCGVSLTGPASDKTVHFVETWAQGRHVSRHRWTVHGATLVTQSGPVPPQLWM